MSANIQPFSELSNALSVKSETNETIFSLFSKFALGRVLAKHALAKRRGVDMVQLLLSLILFRINQKTVGAMHKERFHNLIGCPVRCSEKQRLKSPVKLLT